MPANYYGINYYSDIPVTLAIIILIVALFIKLIIAFFTGSIASGKGRSYAGWWCLSFFLLDIIALIIAACLKDESHSAPRRYYYAPPQYWVCKNCNATNVKGLFCANCGAMKDETNNRYASPSKPSTPTWTCKECQQVNSKTSMNCVKCKTPRY